MKQSSLIHDGSRCMVVVAALLLAGCFRCPVEGWGLTWEQPGLFDKMPTQKPEGASYKHEYQFAQAEGNLGRNRDATTTIEGYTVTLLVYERGGASYGVGKTPGHVQKPGDGTMEKWLKEIFADLSLGEPAVSEWNFRPGSSGC